MERDDLTRGRAQVLCRGEEGFDEAGEVVNIKSWRCGGAVAVDVVFDVLRGLTRDRRAMRRGEFGPGTV
jgi:hypothetical protein